MAIRTGKEYQQGLGRKPVVRKTGIVSKKYHLFPDRLKKLQKYTIYNTIQNIMIL